MDHHCLSPFSLHHPAAGSNLELQNTTNPRKYSTSTTQSFSHFGLVVPDIQAAEARMDAFNVTILKRVGDAVNEDGEIPLAFGMPGSGPETDAALTGLADFGFDGFMIIADPDGNVIEVLQASLDSYKGGIVKYSEVWSSKRSWLAEARELLLNVEPRLPLASRA